VMTIGQAIWWLEMRRPKQNHSGMYPVDFNAII